MQRRVLAARNWALLGIIVGNMIAVLMPRALTAACLTPPSGLVGWWAANGNASDSAGSNPGTLQNYASFAPGEAGLAFNLNGSSDFIQVPASSLWPSGTNNFTIELWANFAVTGSRVLVASDAGGGNNNKWLFWINAGALQFHINDTNGVQSNLGTGAFAPTAGQWYHLAVTRSGSNFIFYINGAAAGTNSEPRPIPPTGAPLMIGQAENNFFFGGLLDEVSIYNRALDPTEILGIYNAGAAGKCGALSSGAAVPYFTDFENGLGPEWGVPLWNTAEQAGFTRFTGRFDNSSQMLTLTNLVIGQAYTLGFDFYAIDSWDGSYSGTGDYFNVGINGMQVFHETFSNNGNPPPNPQTFPSLPDEGRANYGFTPNYLDAVYRNIQVSFIASNATTTFNFSGQNLEAVDNESWGIDNVGVRLSSDLTNTIIRSTSLPVAASTNSISLETFIIAASQPLLASSATNPANYTLREAGANGVLGDSDDVIFPLSPQLPGGGGHSVAFPLATAPLQPGHYRFQTAAGLLDTNSNPVPVFTRDFYIANPIAGAIESTSNDVAAAATALPMTESPVGSGFLTAFAVGSFSSTSDVDYWRFDAEAGDLITVRLESESQGVYPQLYLQNASGQNIATAGGDYGGTVQLQNIGIGTPGTYYLRVWSSNNRSRYWMRVDQSRGPQMESEDNGSQANANQLNLTINPGLYQARVAGSLPAADTAGDFYKIGTLNPGNAISASALFPTGSVLNASQLILSIQLDGNPVALVTNQTGNLNYVVVSNGIHYVHVETTNLNLRAQYLLNVTIGDSVPPVITGTSLPAEGTTTTAIVDRFSLSLSEDVNAASISNSANYELRGAGPDGVFGTADDTLYTVASAGYTSGLLAPYVITDGPLQPGNFRLTVSTNISDRAANHMAAPFVRNFTVANLPGYVIENRNNDAGGLGTSLSFAPTTNSDGSIGGISSVGTPANPQFVAAANFNGDTNLDLVTANWNGGNITILTNNGKGVFQALTNISTGPNPVSVAVADFNNDGLPDIAVANFNGGSVTIVLASSNGIFTVFTNLTGFSGPYNLAATNLNNDGKIDLVVPNYYGNTVSVLLGNGDGTFQVRSNYATGNNPQTVAVGDLNGDGKPDLAVANYGSSTVSVFFGNGDGTFQSATNLPVGPSPRYLAIADVTGDNVPDLVVLQPGNDSVGVLAGNGNGTFQAEHSFASATDNAYAFALGDLNGDGKLDIAVAGYGNNELALLLNNGTGLFTNTYTYAVGQNPIGVAAGDFNNDGRLDLAFAHYYGNYVSIWAGNPFSLLVEDPPGSGLRTALARGTRSNSGDVDYYQFSGNAGDQVILAVDVPGNPPNSSLNYQIQRLDGSVLVSFNSDYTGWGQSGVVILPQTATYLVRVASNNDYQGEYRIRLTIARPPLQLDAENNPSIGQANPVVFARTNNHLQAAVAGYVGVGNAGGDYYNLGNLAGGSVITVSVKKPASSGVSQVLWIYNNSGTLLTNSAAGATNFAFTVPIGQDGLYYVQVTAASGGYSGNSETAVRLFGGSDYIDLGPWFNFQTFTLSMWINPAASQNNLADIMDDNHRSGINWVIQQNNSINNQYVWGPQDNSTGVIFNLLPNTWQHLDITRDSTNVSSVYVNGSLVGTVAAPGQINYDGSQWLRIGRWGGGGRNWTGVIDEVRIWNRPLAQPEIIAGMFGSLTGSETNLVGYWRFNEGYGTNSMDLSPSNHPAALVSGPAWAFLGASNSVSASLQDQYILSFDLTNGAPPSVTGVSLPADGSTNNNIWTGFSVNFSTDMDPVFTRLARTIYRYNGHSYFVTDTATTWWNAETQAVALGGHLAAVNSAAENAWLHQVFSGYGDLWLGLNDLFAEGSFVWNTGEPLSFTNWRGGEPSNSGGYEEVAEIYASDGTWNDLNPYNTLRGIVEVASTTDTDGDGLVDSIDPYPTDPLNAFDLRAAGPDGLFDTADDIVYRIYTTGYASGLSAPFVIADGPLQPGYYRFKVTTSLRDRFGNPIAAAFVRNFTVAPVAGFVEENRRSTNGTSITSLSLNSSNQLDGSFSGFVTTGTGRNPQFIATGFLNGDTNLDLVTANISDGTVSVFLGDGSGNFQFFTNVTTGNGPISIAIADFNGDNKADLAVANYYGNTVSILLGNGDGSFQVFTNYSGFANPVNLAAADFNHDNKKDLVVPNYGGSTITVLFGNGDGTFQIASNYNVGSSPQTVAIGDINGDSQPDLVVANYNSATLSVLQGNADGSFQPQTILTNASNPRYVTLGDVNGDGALDIVAISGATLNVFFGNSNGTFQARSDYNIGSSDPYQVALADLNGDGRLDAIVASYGGDRLITVLNNGDGTFGPTLAYNPGGRPISVAIGDFNHDGRLDIACADYSANAFSIFLGNSTSALLLDPAGTGLRIGAGRGNLADSGDADYWSFSAQTGDRLSIAIENPGSPPASTLHFLLYRPDGSYWTDFYGDYNGRGQLSAVIPVSGTYLIQVQLYNQYYGEYRFRVTLAQPPIQVEVEDNSSIANANGLAFTSSGGQRNAQVYGYIGLADGNGDFYQLGNLATGTQITLGLSKPASSSLAEALEIYNSSGVLVTNTRPGGTNLVFTVGTGSGGAYYAQVIWANPSRASSISNALSFNGGNNYITVGNWAPGPKWSIQAWVMPASLPGGRHTIAGGLGNCQDWGLALQDGRFGTAVRQPGGCSTTYEAPTTANPVNWYFVTSVSDGTNAYLYVNGVLSATGPVDPAYAPYGGGTWIGGESCCGNYFPGLIQDVSIWNRALSAAEVGAFMTNSPTGSEVGLLGYWKLQDGAGTTVTDLSTNGNNGTLVNGPTWTTLAPFGTIPFGLFQQYLLSINLVNTIPPQIVSVSLPGEGTTSTNILDRFSITFTEDMAPATVSNAANYELRGAGPDSIFGTGDDQLYTILNSPTYTAGTTASYLVPDGPLQPGLYRFTIRTNLTDPAGTFLPAAYVRNFSVANVSGFVFENRFDNSPGLATILSLSRTNRPNGSLSAFNSTNVGNNPYFMASGRLNNDTNLDLVVANYSSGNVSVLLGNGDGTFQAFTNYATGGGALAPVLGYFNSDSNLDLAVANYNANTVTVLSGNGNGTFQVLSNYAVGSRPNYLVSGDFNGDSKLDLATVNYSDNTVSILLGNGDGTFQPAVNYPVGAGPEFVAAAYINNDTKLDLVTVNANGNNLSLLLGNGDGTFASAIGIAAGTTPRAVAISDLNRDGKMDLAVLNAGDNTISVMFGNGDGSFQPRTNLDAGTSDGYDIIAADLNGDGTPDLAVSGFNNSTVSVLLNSGGGTFETRSTYSIGNRCLGLIAGDFNNDGRLDLAVGNYYGNNVTVLLGNDTEPLALDAATGLRIGAGRGDLYNGSQADYWRFDALAGDRIFIACENPGSPSGSTLHFILYKPDGNQLADFYGDYTGHGQLSTVAPASGSYLLRIEPYYQYGGEYRFRVTLARPPIQLETEDNSSIGNANTLSYTLNAGHQQASVLGYLGATDSGDYFRLGLLSDGAVVNLRLSQPGTSGLLGDLVIYNSSSAVMAYSPAGATNLSFVVPPGDAGAYFAQVWDAGPTTALKLGGVDGYALRFNGGSDWVAFTNGIIPSSGDFTVECWAYGYGPNGTRELISQGSGGNAFYLGTDGSGSNMRVGDGWQNTGVSFPFNGWHHFAVVKSSTNTLLFVDGVLAASHGGAIPNPAPADALRFARQYDGYGEYWPGSMDEVRIWNIARAGSDIQSSMSNRLTGAESGLVGYWRFDEGTGTLLTDSSPGGNNGLFQNYPVWIPSSRTNVQPSGIFSQYLLALDLRDTNPPSITSVTLPAAGATNFNVIDRFTLGFSKDVDPGINALNRYIRLNNGHAYTITDSSMTWFNAETQARSLGGHLAAINGAAENAWVLNNFRSFATFWIGMNDEAQKGTFVWSSGDPITYTNWSGGVPDNSNNKDYTAMQTDGTWANGFANTTYRGVIEVSGTDSDGDGIPDTLDPYPNDPYNVFDLRAAGPDGLFDTADDQIYHVNSANYTGGLSLDFTIIDGPLQPGYYRFMVTSSLKDRFGNAMAAPFVQYFIVSNVAGYVLETRTNNTAASATALPLVEDPPGFKTAAARGNITGSEVDYWSFTGAQGDLFNMATFVPGSPGASTLHYQVYKPDGSLLVDFYPSYTGDGQSSVYTLPTNGTYIVTVGPYYGFQGEYRFRLTTVSSPLQMESEDNGTLAAANVLNFTPTSNTLSASIGGNVRTSSDLDYFNLGTVSNGYSVFLNVRLPGSSTLSPIVSVYNAANVYQNEAYGGRPNDGVANVPITTTGTYYALVRGGNGTGALNDQYILDVNVLPTGSINFPNLVVSGVAPPSGSSILSGQPIVYTFAVQNVGTLATQGANWLDRVVMSADTILGNSDDIAMGFFPHNGALNPGDSYSITNNFNLPDGISGDFYLIVQTDAGNAINEYLFEGDNVTVSSNTFHVNIAPYPDLTVENLNVAGPDSNNVFTITWNTGNRGTATAPAGFRERFLLRNQTTGQLLINNEQPITNSIPTNSVLPHLVTVVETNSGVYQVQIITDSENDLFEYNASGHAAAEANNTAVTNFQIIAYYNVSLQSSPAGAGVLTGAGTYSSGSPVTVTATPNTNTLPYLFVNWTEGGAFQSASTNYSFFIARDRALVANFTLPTFLIAASNNPPAGGTVTGQGSYFYGTTNVLSALPNFGYKFTNWTDNGSVVGTTPNLTIVVVSNRFVVANYVEANTIHVVTTGTSPTNVATVSGAGTYTNGQSTSISTPQSVTNPPNIYNFHEFRLNGAFAGNSATFTENFSTLDPTNMQFIAFYDTVSILPLITNSSVNFPNPVPATSNLQVTVQFNRSMNTNVTPLVVLTNPAASTQPVVPAGGSWTSTAVSNDTFMTPPITLSTGMDGTNNVLVSQARDLNGAQLAPTNILSLLVDVTPPPNPVLSLTASNSSSASVSWASYSAPPDLNAFRVYLATNNFSSVSGLTAVSSLGSGARAFTYYGLSLDKNYYAAVAAVDLAGNSSPVVTPLAFNLPSTVPPPVTLQVAPVGSSSAMISWNGYDTSSLLGFAGFQLYYENTNFSSVTGHAIRQTLATGARSLQIDNLDRTKTYYFAVVGFNGNNGFNPNVTTASWSDPYAGNIGANLTIGGAGQGTVDILQSMTVMNNAVLTIPAGTTLRFAPGTSLMVQQGALNANGTSLDPIFFTSSNDQPGLTPNPGDWNGITLGTGSGASVLRNVFVKYAGGLTLSNSSPVVDAFSALFNAPAGLTLTNGATLNTSNALLEVNAIGARQLGSAQLGIHNSVIKNNGTNALGYGGLALSATSNWWGSATASDIDAQLQGSVDRSGFLAGEPLLTPAIGTVSNVTQVGSQSVNLRLACRTADSMRLSEDSTFTAVFFAPFTNLTSFQLSSGGGQKTVFAQFRSITGQTSAPVSLTINYITAGPTIASFNLNEGQILNRPLLVTGSASAPLGMAAMEFYVDNIGQGTNAGGSFSQWFDVRPLSSGSHRVKLVARDSSANFATLEHNVQIAPTPPPAPLITIPPTDLVVNTNNILIGGTAEPFIGVRLQTAQSVVAGTNADASGNFRFGSVPLVEGANNFNAAAYDPLGSAASAVRSIVLETIPPAQLILNAPTYAQNQGIYLTWQFPTTGKHATFFQLFWSTNSFSNTNQATGQSQVLSTMSLSLQALAPGNYYFGVLGYDDAGNAGPLSALVSFSYDPLPPSFTIAFDKSSPIGVGTVQVTLSSSKPLAAIPTLMMLPPGTVPVNLPVTNAALNVYSAALPITPFTPSGTFGFTVSGQDQAGNVFNGAPSGPPLVIDVDPPTGAVTTVPFGLVQVTNATNVAVSLVLNKSVQFGSVPQLSFAPPVGSPVALTLSGAGTNWSGTLGLLPSMGSGFGAFSLTATDALANVGHLITSGRTLEIYNTALPSPPGQPVHFEATSLVGGRVQLTWSNVTGAEIYRVYSQTGADFTVPTLLIADNITSNNYVDLPAIDGYYRYVVTASRRGAEGTNSIVRIALSDRTPPPAPTNVTLQLAATGLQISWQAGAGETPNHYNVYRNGSLIQTVSSVTPVIDAPPRGNLSYTVGAVDVLGNEALSDPANIQLLVGAVNNLLALVNAGQAPQLTWTSSDPTAVGFNVYRNGVKQNNTPQAQTSFSDSLGVAPGAMVTYSITAVNATNAESAARTVNVFDVDLQVLANNSGGAQNPLVNRWFDSFEVFVSNSTTTASLPLTSVQLLRSSIDSVPLAFSNQVSTTVGSGNFLDTSLIFPAASTLSAQNLQVRAIQQTDLGGSSVIYQALFYFTNVVPPGTMITVTANQQPLSGGLAQFNVQIFNHGYAPMDLVITRNNGNDPGDLHISLFNPLGQEVSRTYFNGIPPGTIFMPNGTGILRVNPGSSVTVQVPNVLVPAALGTNATFFQASFDTIYYSFDTANQLSSGPLAGGMTSSLALTPYYGTAQTDKQLYSNNDPVIITGQAIDRSTGNPVTNAPLKIGFFSSGYRFYQNVTTDSSGNYQYIYNPPPGLSGAFQIWAAHPDVFDVLNQAQITIYRAYFQPAQGDIRMTKNDTLPFSINLINPGDIPLTGFTLQFQAYQMVGTNSVAITNLSGTVNLPPGFTLGARQNTSVHLALSATIDAPDNASVQYTLTSAEGASAVFSATVTLLPALPIISVVDPAIGYVELSVNRGEVKSTSVTIVNRGLRDLDGVTLTPPTNSWMQINLPAGPDGKIHLPDMPVGATNGFSVTFTPPSDATLDYHHDLISIQGTNAASPFTVDLYALVTSNQKGAVQFYVDDILTYAVPGATVRIKNTILGQEYVTNTDANGYVTVTNLQEGDWAWQVNAPGHSANVGVATIIGDQTVQVDTRLSRSLVTVNFTVEPVPFTDRYEIVIEQTFETHVPAPVLVVDPPLTRFENVAPGFDTTLMVTAKNEGLIQMREVTITGQELSFGTMTPLITYIPVLLPQQSVQIPFHITYTGTQTNSSGGGKFHRPKWDTPGFADCATGGLAGLADFLNGINAICNSVADCADLKAALKIAATVAVIYALTCAPSFSPIGFLPTPCPSIPWPISFVINLISCLGQQLISGGGGGGGGGEGGNGPINTFTGYGGGPPACFVQDTTVWMADGSYKPIAQIQLGDWVRTDSDPEKRAMVRQVTQRVSDDLYEIHYKPAGANSGERTIIATGDHAFWVDGQGWTQVRQLKLKQWLTTSTGKRAVIQSLNHLPGARQVYSLVLREDQAFYANDLLVRDRCGLPPPMPTRLEPASQPRN